MSPPADQASEGLRLNLATGAALTDHTHEKVAEAIIQPLDVWQHAHGRMVLATGTGGWPVPTIAPVSGLALSAQPNF